MKKIGVIKIIWFCNILLLLAIGLGIFFIQDYAKAEDKILASKTKTEKTPWWKLRQQQTDLYYPHQVHMPYMDKEGDSCMLCHQFTPNLMQGPNRQAFSKTKAQPGVSEELKPGIGNSKKPSERLLKQLGLIANEPLKAICHDCHLSDLRAPWRCDLCHQDKTTIWPSDHNFNYFQQHAAIAKNNEEPCRECHLEISFCSDCHFRRGNAGSYGAQDYHPLGYQSRHGIDARLKAAQCGRCHNINYCRDCHRYKQ